MGREASQDYLDGKKIGYWEAKREFDAELESYATKARIEALKIRIDALDDNKEYVMFIDQEHIMSATKIKLDKPIHVAIIGTQDGRVVDKEAALAELKKENQ